MKTLPPTTVNAIESALRRRVENAKLSDVMQANVWYDAANCVAQRMAILNPSLTVEAAATIIAAFSPRIKWSGNVRKALAFACGDDVRGLKAHKRTAERASRLGMMAFAAINPRTAPKTFAFAHNIAGYHDAVTVDIWMCRAAEIGRDAPTIVQYRTIAECVRRIAAEYNMTPATMQALIWIVERGNTD